MSGCTWLKATDTTEWGVGGAPARDTVLIEFKFYHIIAGDGTKPIAVAQNPSIVSNVLVPISADGRYRVEMHVSNYAGELIYTPVVKEVLLSCRLRNCYCTTAKGLLQRTCGCEPTEQITDMVKYMGIEWAAQTLFVGGDFESGDMLVQYGNALCSAHKKEGCDCGCGH